MARKLEPQMRFRRAEFLKALESVQTLSNVIRAPMKVESCSRAFENRRNREQNRKYSSTETGKPEAFKSSMFRKYVRFHGTAERKLHFLSCFQSFPR